MKTKENAVCWMGLLWIVVGIIIAIKYYDSNHTVDVVLASVLIILGTVALVFYKDAARFFLFTKFERAFDLKAVPRDHKLWPVVQSHINSMMRRRAIRMQGYFEAQEAMQVKIKTHGGDTTAEEFEKLESELVKIDRSVENAKQDFLEARKCAHDEGYDVFQSHKPYLSSFILEHCLSPYGEWFNRIPRRTSSNENGGVMLQNDLIHEFLTSRAVGEVVPPSELKFVA